MGSKGGGQTQTTKSEPWSVTQPYLRDIYGQARALAGTPQQYYPGQTYVGALPSEESAYAQRSAYNSAMFGAPGYPVGNWPSFTPAQVTPYSGGPSSTAPLPGTGGSTPGWMGGLVNPIMNAIDGARVTAATQGGAPASIAPPGSTPVTTAKTTNPYLPTSDSYGSLYGGGSAAPYNPAGSPFGNVMGALGQSVTGNDMLGRMSGSLSPYSTQALMGAFSQGSPTVGRYGFDTTIDPYALTPTFGQAGGLDARGTLAGMMSGQADWGGANTVAGAANSPLSGQPNWAGALGSAGLANAGLGQFGTAGNLNATGAIQQALSGQGDYGGLQNAIDAANAPILRQFNEEILPGLNQRATFLNNETGGIKTLNRVLPELGQRMSQNAATLTEGERQRALAAQQQAAALVSQGGLQQGAQASSQLFGAGQSALDRAAQQASQMASQNYGAFGNAWQQAMADRSNAANLVSTGGLSAYGLGLQGAGMQSDLQRALAQQNLQTDTANAGLWNQYRSDLLGLGNLAGGLAGNQSTAAARWGSLFPSLAQAGQAPSADALAYGNYQRGIMENALGSDVNRFNFYQQEPYDRLGFYNQILSGTSGLGGTTTARDGTAGGFSGLGALGGGLGTYGLAAGAGMTGTAATAAAPAIAASPWLWPLVLGGAALGGGLFG